MIESSQNKFKIPDSCPSCHSKVVIDDIRLLGVNEKCPGKNKEIILNFIQKIGIEDLSGKRLDELMAAGMVKNIPDLYQLTVDELMKLDEVKEKLSTKLVESIQKTKNID